MTLKNIITILDDFIEEILIKLTKFKNDYSTSNDQNAYLAGMKMFLGNILPDKELIYLTNKNDKELRSEILELYKKIFTVIFQCSVAFLCWMSTSCTRHEQQNLI